MANMIVRLEGEGGISMRHVKIFLDDKEITKSVRGLDLRLAMEEIPSITIELFAEVSFGDGFEIPARVEVD